MTGSNRTGGRSVSRRTVLGSIGAAGLTLTAGCLGDDEPRGEWPRFRRNARNTGHAPDAEGPIDRPEPLWRSRLSNDIWGSPAIVDDGVYVPDYAGRIYRLDADDGEEDWRFQTDEMVDSSPTVHDGVVYVGSFDEHVYAIDADSGEERWAYEADGIVRSSPAVVDDTVYVGTNCQFTECDRYFDEDFEDIGHLVALDRETGELQWEFETDLEVVSSPAVDETRVYVGSSDGNLYAVERDTGELAWQFTATAPIGASPTLHDDRIYVGDQQCNVFAIDAASGDREHHIRLEGLLLQSSAATDGEGLYLSTGGYQIRHDDDDIEWASKAFRLSTADLSIEWDHTMTGQMSGSSPALAGETVFFATHNIPGFPHEDRTGGTGTMDEDAGLFAFDRAGEERWRATMRTVNFIRGERGFGSSPAVVDERLYIAGPSDHVYCFE